MSWDICVGITMLSSAAMAPAEAVGSKVLSDDPFAVLSGESKRMAASFNLKLFMSLCAIL
jgi:hypothetical protein